MADDEGAASHMPGHGPASGTPNLAETQALPETTQPFPGQTAGGAVVGPYQLRQLIGEGGMGEVWLAEQTEPVRRRVALKLIKTGMDTREVVARFESERQALALMDHPAIAKVFDAGSTAEGRPYFVMEYVAGMPITSYCDRHKLSTRRRLELFILVCEGVQHAHQKAIIHRDLKPSNILVTEVDGRPAPRIIDFGVAKATSVRLNADTMYTRVGAMIGTLGYMSPEQADSGGEDIDTRSDVYSLGVVLYELLSGTLPFDFRRLAYDEVLRCLREQDAPHPSTRLRTSGDSAVAAKNRSVDPPTLASQLRGDPDAISLKALEKDRSRRYATPSDLAADIARYLRNEPVLAHAPSVAYRARKYIRRHRLGVALAGLLTVLLLTFALAQTIELQRIRRERDRADRITEFMASMFKVSDPSQSRGNSVTAREILDKSSNQIETGLGQDSQVRSQLMQVMAQTYQNLGLYGRAHALSERVLEERRRTLGSSDPKTLESMTRLGFVLFKEGRDDEAERMDREAIELEGRILGQEAPLTLQTKDDLAIVLLRQAHFTEVEKLERDLIDIKTRKLGPENEQTLRSRDNLASALAGQSRFAEAVQEFRQVLDLERRTEGADDPRTLASMQNLANALQEEGKYAESEKLYRETLAIEERVLGPEHPDTLSTMSTLGNTIRLAGDRNTEAEALFRKSLEIEQRVLGPDHPWTMETKEGLANVLAAEHHYTDAEQLHRQILTTRLRTLGPDNTDTLLSQYNIAEVLDHEGEYGEAEALIRDTLTTQTRVLDADDPDKLASRTLLARILLHEHRPQEAEVFARQAFDPQLRTLGPQHKDTMDSLETLGTAMTARGRYDEAKHLYLDIIARTDKSASADGAAQLWYSLACLAAKAGRTDESFDDLEHAVKSGYSNPQQFRTDDDLKAIRHDPRLNQLIAQARPAAVP